MPGYPVVTLPAVTVAQMREVDRIMVDELGIGLVQMMENAGRSLAELTLELHRPEVCVVLAGTGGNGGGGLAAARHLHNRGVAVRVVVPPGELSGVPGRQLAILRRLGVPVDDRPPVSGVDVIIDAMVGYSLRGPLRAPYESWAGWAAAADAPVVALDVPSGLDPDTGTARGVAVTADATVTLALPKRGLLTAAPGRVGDLYAADISVPPGVLARVGAPVDPRRPPFAAAPIVRVAVPT